MYLKNYSSKFKEKQLKIVAHQCLQEEKKNWQNNHHN